MLVSPKAVLVTNTGAQTVVWREVPGVCKHQGQGVLRMHDIRMRTMMDEIWIQIAMEKPWLVQALV